MSFTINSLNDKINRLSNENIGLGDEARNAQENLRLSANQNQKIMQ